MDTKRISSEMSRVWLQVVIVLAVSSSVLTAVPCTTPKGKSGECIPLKGCGSVNSIAQKFTETLILSDDDRKFLNDSVCGRFSKETFVCCQLDEKAPELNTRLLPSPEDGVCGETAYEQLTIGPKTKINEFPWLAILEVSNGTSKFSPCQGTLINELYVISTAHCLQIERRGYTLSTVKLGEWDQSSDIDCEESICNNSPLSVPIEKLIIHEKFDSSAKLNDIGLIRLSYKVPYSEFIKPICLPRSELFRNKDYTGEKFEAAGWGRTVDSKLSNKLLKVDLDGVSNVECSRIYYNLSRSNIINDDHLCAGGEGTKNTCSGDGGGPLMGRSSISNRTFIYIAGIVAFGAPCGKKNFPSVQTRVAPYIQWIESNVLP